MRRATLVLGAFLVVGVVGAGLHAGAQEPGTATAPAADTSRMVPTPATEPPDLTGQWRLDYSRSDSLRGPGGPGRPRGPRMGRGGGPGSGGWGGGGPMGRGRREGRPDGNGGRPVQLPNLMHVTHASTLVSFEDSTGTVIQEITTVAAEADTFAHAPGALQLKGQWNGDRLEVQHAGRGGAKVTDTYSLEDAGRSLVIRTAIAASGDLPAREFKRVYRRES